jgi:hypothetical protein
MPWLIALVLALPTNPYSWRKNPMMPLVAKRRMMLLIAVMATPI